MDKIDRTPAGLNESLKSEPFNLARERMRKKAEALLKKAGAPQEGIWYWVFLAPDWKLITWNGPSATHMGVWPDVVNAYLAPHYKLSPPAIAQAKSLVYAFPRGRVSAESEGNMKYFFIRHGNDTPTPEGLKQVESDFNLIRHLLEGMAEEIYDGHETTVGSETEEMRKLLGQEL